MRILIILLLQLTVAFTYAQNITGIWRGAFSGGQVSIFERLQAPQAAAPYKYEVQIRDVSGQLKGVTYSYQDTTFYGKASFSGTFDPKTNRVLVQEKKMLELKIASNSSACIMTCYLEYSKLGREEFLEGPFTSINVRDSSDCGRGRVRLRKVPFSDFKKEPFLNTPKKNLNEAPDPRDKVRSSSPPVKKSNLTPQKTPPASVKKTPAPPPVVKKNTSPAKTDPAIKKDPVTAKKNQEVLKKDQGTVKQELNAPGIVKKAPDTIKKANPVTVAPIQPNKEMARPEGIKPKPEKLTTIAGRENVLISVIEVDSPNVTVRLYDNGVIDKDTISVFRNNQMILQKKQLTAKPLTLSFRLENPGEVQELVMVAENLGEIPPNTALMVVECGSLKKEVRISSNLQKNAMVRFKLKE